MVGDVEIRNRNVFDLDDPREDRWLYRLANRLHMKTRAAVIRQQLLFEDGEPFVARNLAETERLLRSNRYIHDASIQPVAYHDGQVDIAVETTDVWTLMPQLSLSRSGGKNKTTVGIEEMNLLGTGTAIELAYKSDLDRQYRVLKYMDRNLGNSWYGLTLDLADNSDGYAFDVDFGKPFHSLDSRHALGVKAQSFERIDSYYDRGEIASEYLHRGLESRLFTGWSKGLSDGWTTRYILGLGFEDHRFEDVEGSEFGPPVLPQDRQYVYPFIGIERAQDRFEKTSNRNQINVTEDLYLGTRLAASVGFASAQAGSTQDAMILRASGRTGFGSSERNSLILEASVDGRIEDGSLSGANLGLAARYYRRQSDHRLLFVGLRADLGERLDLDQLQYLGGDNGLRGYPARYQIGQKSVLFTLEQRLFTDWYPFRLARVGGAVFFDAGKVWGGNPHDSPELGLLRDVGFGLRLGSTRSGTGRMIHIDLAFPLDNRSEIDSPQFLISTHRSF